MNYDFPSILRRFQIEGAPGEVEPFGSGHIHETFKVSFSSPGGRAHYILQRINKNIFPEPEPLQENIQRVTTHLARKLRERGVSDYENRVLRLYPTKEGKTYYVDETGHFWRVYNMIQGGRTYDRLETLDQAFQAAKAFGLFQADLQDLPGPPLHEILPRFHDGPWRFQQFQEALRSDPENRAAKAGPEIAFLEEHAPIFQVLPRLQAEGKLPLRITHNDTKINNVVLSDTTGEALAVIDLDTVMPGLSLFDFGDIVRTTVSDTDEDEMDLEKVRVDLNRFSAVLRGFLEGAGSFLNETERAHLVFSGKLITLIIGTRFLTDYLAGDVYFHVHRPDHNLHRARTQFKLVQSIQENEEAMNRLVEEA